MCVYHVYTHIHPPQGGDSAVILATQYHHSEALKELVAAGANLNLSNQVKFWLLLALIMYHHQLSVLGRSDCSNDLCQRGED